MSKLQLPESASAKETAKRVPVINDPVITEALRNLFEDEQPSERERLRTENAGLRSFVATIADTKNWHNRRHAGGETDLVWIGLTDPIADAYRALNGRFPVEMEEAAP